MARGKVEALRRGAHRRVTVASVSSMLGVNWPGRLGDLLKFGGASSHMAGHDVESVGSYRSADFGGLAAGTGAKPRALYIPILHCFEIIRHRFFLRDGADALHGHVPYPLLFGPSRHFSAPFRKKARRDSILIIVLFMSPEQRT